MKMDFDAADEAGKGYIKRKNLGKVLASQMGSQPTEEQVAGFEILFEDCGDDKIYFSEYVLKLHDAEWMEIHECAGTKKNGTPDARWGAIYDEASTRSDGDGLDKVEFRRIKRLIRARNATSRAPDGSRLVDMAFSSIDDDNDGTVSKEEFMHMIEKWRTTLPKKSSDTQEQHVLTALETTTKESNFLIVDSRTSKLTQNEAELVEYLFKRVDADDNGSISYKEFLSFRQEFYFSLQQDQVVEEVFEADKNHDDRLELEEFKSLFKALKVSLAKSNLGGVFFREHLIDLCTDVWDDANPKIGPPPIKSPIQTQAKGMGSCWHCIGGSDAVADEKRNREEQLEKREEKKVKLTGYGAMSGGGKPQGTAAVVKKVDDFNFSRVFEARNAGYGGKF